MKATPWLAVGYLFLSFLAVASAQPVMEETPAPASEQLSTAFHVKVEQTDVPVYLARVCDLSVQQRQTLGLPQLSGTTTTSFASFDLSSPAQVSVTCADPVTAAQVLPTSAGIKPAFSGHTVTLTVDRPGSYTLEINGQWISSLQLFANPPETNVPDAHDPNVIYFGPGVHTVQTVHVTSGQTLYLAPGAVLYGQPTGPMPRAAIVHLDGSNITVRGRGVIDGSLCPRGTRSVLDAHGSHITIEGVVLRDSAGFTLCPRRSDNVTIENVKVFGWRGNSDGMDICNCRHVRIAHCFLRTFDDLIVLKTDKGQGEEHDVNVTGCVLWNEFAHALSLGAELREPLSQVVFSDCDIIHDKGREWLLRVYNCDSAPVSDVTFDRIRIEEARRLMSLWIGTAVWSKESERGTIDRCAFRGIDSAVPSRPGPWADLVGYDAMHAVNGATFQDVKVGGAALTWAHVQKNAFVQGVTITP